MTVLLEKLGEASRTYLNSRGCSPSFQEEFELFSQNVGRTKETFCVPRFSLSGKMVSFEERGIYEEYKSKTKTHPHADHNPYFIGLKNQRRNLFQGLPVILVEGFLDAVTALRVVNRKRFSVLSLGRAYMEENQLIFLKTLGCFVYLALDNDKTGRKAYVSNAVLFKKHKVPFQKLKFVGGKDFNEVWRKRGDEGLRKNLITLI